jgi:hypothetical protein
MAINFMENVVSYPERFSEYFRKLGLKFEKRENGVWILHQNIATYVGPLEDKNPAKTLPFEATDAVLCYGWNDSIERSFPKKTELLVSKKHQPLDSMDSAQRIYLHRDLKFYRTRRIEVEEVLAVRPILMNKIEAEGKIHTNFSVFYSDFLPNRRRLIEKKYDDIIQYFGIFFESRIIGYAKFFVFSKQEAQLQELVIDPDFEYPKVAVSACYSFGHYYLEENNLALLNLGAPYCQRQVQLANELLKSYGYAVIQAHSLVHVPANKIWDYRLENHFYRYFAKSPEGLCNIRRKKAIVHCCESPTFDQK